MNADLLRWWDPDIEHPGRALVDAATVIEESPDFKLRCDLNLASARMFEGAPVPALHAYSGRYGVGLLSALNADPTIYNAMRSVIMGIVNQIAGGKTTTKATTTGGDPSAQRRAKGLSRFTRAVRRTNRANETYPKAWMMACSADVAAVHYFEQGGRILIEPVFANELIYNPNESMFGTPRRTIRRRFMDKQVVAATWGRGNPALRDAIDQADTIDLTELGLPSDMLRLYEGWSMPTLPGAKDGRHVIAMATKDGAVADDGLIFAGKWERPRPPLELIVYEPALAGPYGRSLAAQLAPLQISLNKDLYKASQNLRMVAVPRVFAKTGSNISTGTLGNMPGDVIKGNEAPQFILPQAVGEEMFRMIDDTETRMFKVARLNQQLAQGQKPPGLNSAIALQTHTDLVARQQILPQERYESMIVQGDEQIIWLAEDMHKRGLKLSVMANDGDALEKIDYADIRLDEGEYVIEVQEESPLPSTPSGKADFALQLSGSPSPVLQARAAEMLESLDPEAELDAATAVQRAIDADLEDIIENGKPHPPEPYFGAAALKEGVMRAQAMFATGYLNKVPQRNLDLLAQWMDEASAAAAPPPAPAPVAAPIAPAPVSAPIDLAPVPVAAPVLGGA